MIFDIRYLTTNLNICFCRQIMFGVLISALLMSGSVQAQEPTQLPIPTTGEQLWAENCMPCHGPMGEGNGPTAASIPNGVPNLTDAERIRTVVPADYFDIIKNGRLENLMPPWQNRFDDHQIWDLAAYSLMLSLTEEDLRAGEMVFAQQCADCHGENGSVAVPNFTDWRVTSQQSLQDWQVGYASNPAHEQLADDELWPSLQYIRTLAFVVPSNEGLLRGQLRNGTVNEGLAEQEVTLHILENDSRVGTFTTVTDAQGAYEFDNLSTAPNLSYRVESSHQDIFYLSPNPARFEAGVVETTLDLEVYDTTEAADNIEITNLHFIVAPGLTDIRVVQIFVIGNPGNQTYVGVDGKTLEFALPDGMQGVTFQNDVTGERYLTTENGFQDTEPVQPGPEGASIVATYSIPHDGRTLTVDVPLPADTQEVSLLLSDRGATLTSDHLTFSGSRQIQGDNFAIFSGGELSADQSVELRFSRLNAINFAPPNAPNSGATTETVAPATPELLDQEALRWFLLGLGGVLLLVVVIGYPIWHSRQHRVSSPQERLAVTIAELDAAFEAGELSEEVYRQARGRYKAELAVWLNRANG